MNKEKFINELSNKLYYSKEQCIIINDILENNLFFSKKRREKIIEEFIQKLKINNKEALKIYDTSIKIIKDEVKNKIKNPLRNQY